MFIKELPVCECGGVMRRQFIDYIPQGSPVHIFVCDKCRHAKGLHMEIVGSEGLLNDVKYTEVPGYKVDYHDARLYDVRC